MFASYRTLLALHSPSNGHSSLLLQLRLPGIRGGLFFKNFPIVRVDGCADIWHTTKANNFNAVPVE